MILLRFHPREKCELCLHGEDGLYTNPVSYFKISRHGFEIEVYELHFEENLAIGCGHTWFPRSSWLGYHKEDTEFVAVYQDTLVKSNRFVYFSAHSHEGKFYRWSECELDNGDLVVYVALNSHALYPYSGTYPRYCCLANDVTSKRGIAIIPKLISGRQRSKDPPNPFPRT